MTIRGTYLGVTHNYVVKVDLPDLWVDMLSPYDDSGNPASQPTNSQSFKMCAPVRRDDDYPVISTKVAYTLRYSRGFGNGGVLEVSMTEENPQACLMSTGLEIGDYVDVTLSVDFTNAILESNENNNVRTFRVSR